MLIVICDFKHPQETYTNFFKALNHYPHKQIFNSVFAIDTEELPGEVFNKLDPFSENDAGILILPVSEPISGKYDKEIMNWVQNRIYDTY